ncbi:MAG: hypothetical protein ABQ298_12805 [Puniceicoccaceae bacterium]
MDFAPMMLERAVGFGVVGAGVGWYGVAPLGLRLSAWYCVVGDGGTAVWFWTVAAGLSGVAVVEDGLG